MRRWIYSISLLLGLCQNSLAEQTVAWYNKLSYNYILDQSLVLTGQHEFSDQSYSFETGLEIDREKDTSYRLGFYWFDQVGMNHRDKVIYDPKYFEVFSEKSFNVDAFYARIGLGFKLYQDVYIKGSKSQLKVIDSWLDRATARFSFGVKLDNWEVGAYHHSNWFVGKPVDDRWEYSQTSFSVSFLF